MKRIQLFVALTFISLSLIAQKTINDPNAEARQVSGFRSISVSNSFEVYISQGTEEGLAISASKEEYRRKIETKVERCRWR